MSAVEFQVADRFPAGTKVGVYPRVHDFFTPGQTPAVAHATVGKDGAVKLTGLVEHGPYFLAAEIPVTRPTSRPPFSEEVDEWRSVAFVASSPAAAQTAGEANDQAALESSARAQVVQATAIDTATAPGGAPIRPVAPVIEGARDTSVLPERIEGAKKGTPLASHTATGEAVVVGEPEEKPKKAARKSARKGAKKAAKKAAAKKKGRQ